MKTIETKLSTINDEIKTENIVTDAAGFIFKIEKITVGNKAQRQSS